MEKVKYFSPSFVYMHKEIHMKHFVGHLIFLAMIALFGLAAMFLWNELLPGIFGLPVINYWQTVGLMILARIIFGGYGEIGRGIAHGSHGRNNSLRDKWLGMSEEERNAFIKRRGNHSPYDHSHHRFTDDTGKDPESGKK
jgi:hypothetical protein